MVRQVVQMSKSTTPRNTQAIDSTEYRWLGSTNLCTVNRHDVCLEHLSRDRQITGVCTLLAQPLVPVGDESKEMDPRRPPFLLCELPLDTHKRAHPREYWTDTLIPKMMQFYEMCKRHHQQAHGQGLPRVIIICDTGNDASVIMATALLCKYFQPNGSNFEPVESTSTAIEHSKLTIRQRLLFIQCHNPMAQPPRRLLKELNNYFLGASAVGDADS